MGIAPPPDMPPPAAQDEAAVDAGFEAGPPVAELCGFKIPSFLPALTFKIPSINFPPALPDLPFSLAIGIRCDVENPLDLTASTPWGGGRVGNADPDPDDQYADAT